MRLSALGGPLRRSLGESASDLLARAALLLLGFWLGYSLCARLGVASSSRASCPAPAGDASAEPLSDRPSDSPPGCDPELTLAHVRLLAETIGPRPAGSAEELQAARYLHGYLSGLGYRTRLQGPIPLADSSRPDVASKHTYNVVAFGPPSAPPGPALLIGAHYDSIALREPSPGGNDNGSGVAAMLELARIAAHLPLPCPLCFVAFGAEERVDDDPDHHHYGSRYLHAHQAQALAAMVSVDMIGVGERLHLRHVKPAPEPLLALLEAAASRVGIAVSRKPDPGHSDHEPFARAGLPAVWIQRLDDPANHSPSDTADRVKPVYIQSVVSLLTELLANLTCDDLDRIAAYSGG